MSALAGLKLLGVSAGLLLARGASRSRGTRRGRRSPQEVKIETKIGRTSNPWNRRIFIFGFEYQLMESLEKSLQSMIP